MTMAPEFETTDEAFIDEPLTPSTNGVVAVRVYGPDIDGVPAWSALVTSSYSYLP